MIYVIDNGRVYSDHRIYFVEVDDGVDAAHRDELIELIEKPIYEKRKVLATAKEFSWRIPDEKVMLKPWLDDFIMDNSYSYDEREELAKLGTELREKIFGKDGDQ